MYSRYAQSKNWAISIISQNKTESGGLKEIIFEVKGNEAFGDFQHEAGVHRVQRIPSTESQGRVHTSTVTVAIMPEVEDVDFQVDPKDVEMDTYA